MKAQFARSGYLFIFLPKIRNLANRDVDKRTKVVESNTMNRKYKTLWSDGRFGLKNINLVARQIV